VAGTWVNSGNAQNGGGFGGIPGSINTFQINFDTPPELPLIIRSYLSLLSIDDAGDPIGPVNNSIGNGTNNIQFKLYLVGYKIAEVARFKGIPLE
jgi:hypothetical protein